MHLNLRWLRFLSKCLSDNLSPVLRDIYLQEWTVISKSLTKNFLKIVAIFKIKLTRAIHSWASSSLKIFYTKNPELFPSKDRKNNSSDYYHAYRCDFGVRSYFQTFSHSHLDHTYNLWNHKYSFCHEIKYVSDSSKIFLTFIYVFASHDWPKGCENEFDMYRTCRYIYQLPIHVYSHSDYSYLSSYKKFFRSLNIWILDVKNDDRNEWKYERLLREHQPRGKSNNFGDYCHGYFRDFSIVLYLGTVYRTQFFYTDTQDYHLYFCGYGQPNVSVSAQNTFDHF